MFDLAFLNQSLRFFFVMTPFFVLSMFLALTPKMTPARKKLLALQVASAVLAASWILLLFGKWLFVVFGITIDAFRIGGGALLFLSAVQLVCGTPGEAALPDSPSADIAVVPLAIPVTVGPATTAFLMVAGADQHSVREFVSLFSAVTLAALGLGAVLFCAPFLDRLLGKRGITIFSKLTGLILSALASQMIFTGVRAFLR